MIRTLGKIERKLRPGKTILVVLLLAASLGTGLATASDAEARRWYWTEGKAEKRLKQKYRVRSAWCTGSGHNWRIIRGREYFTQFYCSGRTRLGDSYGLTLYPKGRRSFRWFKF